jgi:hypothetical protein
MIILACYHQQNSEGVWRVCFGLGIVVSRDPQAWAQAGKTLALEVIANIPYVATPLYLLFPCPHGQFYPIPKSCHKIQLPLLAGYSPVLEAHAWYLYVSPGFYIHICIYIFGVNYYSLNDN